MFVIIILVVIFVEAEVIDIVVGVDDLDLFDFLHSLNHSRSFSFASKSRFEEGHPLKSFYLDGYVAFVYQLPHFASSWSELALLHDRLHLMSIEQCSIVSYTIFSTCPTYI